MVMGDGWTYGRTQMHILIYYTMPYPDSTPAELPWNTTYQHTYTPYRHAERVGGFGVGAETLSEIRATHFTA